MKKTNLFVFDGQTEQLLTVLSNEDNNMSPYWEAPVEENLNGDFIFEFKTPMNDYLVEGNLVAYKDMDGNFQLFQIYKANKYHIDGQLNVHVYCEHAFYELSDDIVEDLRVIDGTAQEAMTKALSASRWEVGQVDDLGTGTVNFYYQNATKNLQDVVATFGGELRYRVEFTGNQITGRFVDLLARRGSDTGKRFEYNKDLTEVNRTVQVDGLKTALYGRGNGEETDNNGYSRKVTFADVVWVQANGDPVDKPTGQEWVGDPTALAKWGRANGTRHRFGTFDVDSTDPAEILSKTWQELQRVSTPNVTYELKVIDLERIAGLDHEKVRIGDTVFVIDRDIDLRIEARVVKITYDLDAPENCEVILGNFIDDITTYNKKIEEIQATLTDRKGVWDKADTALQTVDDLNIAVQAPSVPANVSAQGLFKTIILKWTFDPSIKTSAYEVYASKVNNFTPDSSNLVFRGKTGGYVHNANTNETWYFRIRSLNPAGTASAFTQQFSATTLQVATADFQDLSITDAKVHDLSADKITFGTLDGNKATIVNIDADNINAGKLKAQYVEIGSTTTYQTGYDPSTKETPSGSQAKADQAEENAKSYTDSQLTNYVSATTYSQDIANLQSQIDGNITSWFYDYDPTLDKAPVTDWTTDTDKDKHVGDLFYNTVSGYGWRFAKDSSTGAYSWIEVKDTDIQTALANASQAQDTADSKRRVFVSQPVPPYDAGDLWTNGQTVYRSNVTKTTGATFAMQDWVLVGDVTSQNTSADTAKVNGVDASTVTSQASAGQSAMDKITSDVGTGTIETTSGSQSKANQAEANAKTYVDNALVNYVDATTYSQDIQSLQSQIDGQITSWFYSGEPTLNNAPAVDWTTDELKNQHLGDLYFDSSSGYAYRFRNTGTAYEWTQIQDIDIQTALQNASKAQDTADSKRRVFVTTPVPPYDVGDLWTQGTSGDLMKCKVARASGSYIASDWEKAVKYTDDTRAVQAETNAKNYAKPAVTAFYDVDFINDKAFWSDSYNGQTVSPTTVGTINLSTEASRGGKTWTITGEHWLYSLNPIPVNVNRVYQVTFRVRQTADATTGGMSVYAGVATLDNNFNNLTGGDGTHRYCAVEGAVIHQADGWQTFTGTITGVGNNANEFRAGTAYVRPMFIVNYQGGNGTAEVDFLDFQDVTEMLDVEKRLSDVDLRTTDDSIVATVRSSVSYQNDLQGKADTSTLGNYASKDDLTQAKSDMQGYTDQQIANIDFTPYATTSYVDQKADSLDFKFSSSGGVNLLKNSVGFAGTDFWTVTLDTGGTVDSIQNAELSEKGVGSGFVINGAKLSQTIVNAPQYHTISTLVKKGTAGSGYIQVTYSDASGVRTDRINFDSGTAYDYQKYEIIIQPVGNTITVDLYGTADSGIIFTGTMVNVGNVALQWQHSAGEIYNTNVLMDLNGIRVNSSSYNGYTMISPTEFSGYAEVPDENNNLVMTKVFTLNKDVTEVSKIDVDKELTMAPVKIVPVQSDTYNGWAFIAED